MENEVQDGMTVGGLEGGVTEAGEDRVTQNLRGRASVELEAVKGAELSRDG